MLPVIEEITTVVILTQHLGQCSIYIAVYIIAESGIVYHTEPQFFTLTATFCKINLGNNHGKTSSDTFGIRFAF